MKTNKLAISRRKYILNFYRLKKANEVADLDIISMKQHQRKSEYDGKRDKNQNEKLLKS
jgi:methyl coenzyme M reductase gamma subunit